MRIAVLLLVTSTLWAIVPAQAQVYPKFGAGSPTYSLAELQMMHRYQLRNLRAEALRQQTEDGGRLSTAGLARLQRKLDALNDGFIRSVRSNDPY